jgi:osmoprotectant transport system permease protein
MFSCVLGVSSGVVCAKREKISGTVINFFSALKMIPSLALLMLMLPILGTGFRPAFIALSLHAIPVILISTYTGFMNISPAIIESAQGMGLSGREILIRIEFPLALPIIFNGIRTGMVDIIASAALIAYIGAGGLGEYIVSGLSFMDYTIMLTGGLTIALLAILADIVLFLLQKKMIWYQN